MNKMSKSEVYSWRLEPALKAELEAAAAIPPEDTEVKMALAQLYSRTGEANKSEVLMASLTGGTSAVGANDFFAPVLREDVNPAQAAHDAEQNLSNIGDQFESGEFDRLDANSYSIMDMVALSWARMGWARYLQGDSLVATQFLDSAWQLSLSGTVANRLALIYEKSGSRDRAQHMYALAAAAGGPDAQKSEEQVRKLNPATAEKLLASAATELEKMRTLPLPALASGTASARFVLLFDNSSTADRVQFIDGDQALNTAAVSPLQTTDFPVKFPDVSSIKVIRLAKVSCANSSCSVSLVPLPSMQSGNKVPPQGQTLVKADATGGSASSAPGPAIVLSSNPGGITPPHLVVAPDPTYPDAARRAKIQGSVLIQCTVEVDGAVSNASVLKSLRKDMDASALDAIRMWKFEPATKDGKPVAVQVRVEVAFHLYKDEASNYK